MSKAFDIVLSGPFLAAACMVLVAVAMTLGSGAWGPDQAVSAEPAPPKGQEYTGAKECASCHFKQFLNWSKTKHAKSFDLLPEKYQSDEECLACHTTGYGEPSGFIDAKETPALRGTGCEQCHGPGSKHAEIAKEFGKDKLSSEQEKKVRDSIWMMLPRNVCIECHKTQAHGKTGTPKELKKKEE
ncbi:hypothetical protein LCGC14_2791940 [marine sediment metagenome]|uniref:Cytochrome c-552/4 domain-containing protein n=1 Tax=marine sediment metagenome TaxID=412755 RepID=A0A0F8ZCC0_9ZZZZ